MEQEPQESKPKGLNVEILLHADPNKLTEEELETLKSMVERDVRHCLEDFLNMHQLK